MKTLSAASLDKSRLPRHLAIIMDGNGRWAKAKGLPRLAGHKAGVDSVREMVKACTELKIPILTLYAFSTENWARPQEEVTDLMGLLAFALRREAEMLDKNHVRLSAIGHIEGLPRPCAPSLSAPSKSSKTTRGCV